MESEQWRKCRYRDVHLGDWIVHRGMRGMVGTLGGVIWDIASARPGEHDMRPGPMDPVHVYVGPLPTQDATTAA